MRNSILIEKMYSANTFNRGFIISLLLVFLTSEGNTSTYEETTCAIIFSRPDFRGNKFILKDFDQSVNTRNDYRESMYGWGDSITAHVMNGCVMNICSSTYFQGECKSLAEGDYDIDQLVSPILSANCTCARECKCSDIHVPNYKYGRVYLEGGCQHCYSKYLELWEEDIHFPEEYRDRVTSIVIRKGCTLTTFSKPVNQGNETEISVQVVESFNSSFGSYIFNCNDSKPNVPSFRFRDPSKLGAPIINIPKTDDELIRLISSNFSLAFHPGILAALESMDNGRSPRQAYILWIGTGNLLHFDSHCTSLQVFITECRIPVVLPEIAVGNGELRLIYANAIGDNDDPMEDYRWIASLDDYLSNDRELKDRIPNVVIVRHNFEDEDIGERNSRFQRKLWALHALRTRVLDEKYSNVVFLLKTDPVTQTRNPEVKLMEFEAAVQKTWSFPLPLHFVIQKPGPWNSRSVKVNGNWKMSDEEYFPRNAYHELMLICEKSGDPFGLAVMKEALPDDRDIYNVTLERIEILWRNHSRVEVFKQVYSQPFTQQVLYRVLQEEKQTRRDNTFELLKRHLKETQEKMVELENRLETSEARRRESDARIKALEINFFKLAKLMNVNSRGRASKKPLFYNEYNP